MPVFVVGVNHRSAPVELRERLAVSAGHMPAVLDGLRDEAGVGELALLSTCNRTELYAIADSPASATAAANWLACHQRAPLGRLQAAWYVREDLEAIRHMMRVASGLDSMVLGEPQVLGQMKEAYAVAHQAGTVGKELERCFQQVFAVAKKVRSETAIGASPVSMAFAAVSMARHLFADLARTRALLVGAGEMISLVASHLAEQGVREITVANRTLARAHELADRHGGRAVSMEEIPWALENADIVVSCTAAPVPVLGKGVVERALRRRRHRPMFIVDLAVPRDVEPEVAELDDVYLYTVDHLQGAVDVGLKAREAAAGEAEAIIAAESARFSLRRREQGAVPALRAIRARVEAQRDAELARALGEIRHGVDPEAALRRFARALTGKILHEPSLALRQAAADGREDLLGFACTLFAVNESAAVGADPADAADAAAGPDAETGPKPPGPGASS